MKERCDSWESSSLKLPLGYDYVRRSKFKSQTATHSMLHKGRDRITVVLVENFVVTFHIRLRCQRYRNELTLRLACCFTPYKSPCIKADTAVRSGQLQSPIEPIALWPLVPRGLMILEGQDLGEMLVNLVCLCLGLGDLEKARRLRMAIFTHR